MIEMLGVLAIIGVLSVGGIAGYSKAMLKYKTNKTIDQITMLTTNIRTLYAQQKTFEELSNATAISMGVVPDEMIVDGALTNPFSGTVTIGTGSSIAGQTNRAFTITATKLPKEACMAIATSDWGSNYSSGLIAMGIGGAVADTTYAGCQDNALAANTTGDICAAKMPLDVARAAAACAAADNNNIISFKYY